MTTALVIKRTIKMVDNDAAESPIQSSLTQGIFRKYLIKET